MVKELDRFDEICEFKEVDVGKLAERTGYVKQSVVVCRAYLASDHYEVRVQEYFSDQDGRLIKELVIEGQQLTLEGSSGDGDLAMVQKDLAFYGLVSFSAQISQRLQPGLLREVVVITEGVC